MTLPFTLLIDPVPADSPRTDFSDTFHEVNSDAPALRVDDLSAQRGDGIFETLGFIDGSPQEVGPHIGRLCNSAEICELPAPNVAQWFAAITHAMERLPRTGEIALKIVLSRGVEPGPVATAWLQATAAPDFGPVRTDGVRAVTLDRGYPRGVAEQAPWLLMGAKTLSYAVNMAALREAKRRGADDTIFLTHDGFVLEGPTSSVVIRSGGVYVTPVPSGAILHGTTQQSVFEYLQAAGERTEYRDLTAPELRAADAVWLVSSIRMAVHVTELDGQSLPTDPERTLALNRHLLARTT
ncbi:aminodeoxychorismate lyase [Cryobacterium sp. TMT1-21]|uniref:Aminodeoxychorismate lyase n=1 Tax=Cryobacterium shii TaxID=1259235 RepID=A0AAQ2C4S3_9MICO|nr:MULTISPECIES: aminodeoxychorismate lyase [Cryobacterium]TFC42790.1 aminodeoxychorismate lyase [Cryobacterium shii]TFC89007.1 aminodeoxychorismate lyase [Cryobacterium sp. TmT2-59]TFD11589.1 aminodeoxychorismate lyase [Cryobacterium sp. TMT4-10]TFD14725.1 aminodeoxychorismate lyase [Cryobacterium sp. TMT1-21]TFD22312.1 aminodeoxychorismate lyase [Cryobacterium sp. TMT2-23]